METGTTTTWAEFPNRGKAIVEEIPASEDLKISKRVFFFSGFFLSQTLAIHRTAEKERG